MVRVTGFSSRLSFIATKSSETELELIVYNYNETDDDLDISDKIEIQLSGLPDGKYSVEELSLDRKNNNTYMEWQREGSPKHLMKQI